MAFSIPRDTGIAGARDFRAVVERIDLLGFVGFAIATAALMGFLFSLPHASWLMLLAGILAAVGLFTHERRASRPFFDMRLLVTNGALSRTYLRMGMTTFCIYTIIYGFTQWLQAARNVPAREAGLLLLPMTLISIVITPIISPRNLIRGPLIAAASASLVGSIGVLLIETTTAIVWVIAIAVIFGLTLGMGSSPNQLALYGSVASEQVGTASALLRTFGYVGSIASSGMIGVAFHGDVNDGRLHIIAGIMAVVSAITLALTLADNRLCNRAASTPLAAVPRSGS